MAIITEHDGSYKARAATEPLVRTVARVASRGPLGNYMDGLPHWYCNGQSVARTVNVTGTPEKRRTGR